VTCRAGLLSSFARVGAWGVGIARAFVEAGAPVVAVARTGQGLAELAATSANIRTEIPDAADETVAWS
jgi:NADP-dependent 3-hydroxy acid dehydrogenase YdfG